MKAKHFALFIVLITSIYNLFGQDDKEEKLEKFKSQKIAFITEKLQLTTQEAQAFWPVYNEYDNKKQAIQEEKLKTGKYYNQSGDNISEKEASELADRFVGFQMREAQLAEEYNKKFKSVLPANKVLKLYQVEIQFKRQLLKRLKQEGREPK
jgi:hypothetical protein